MILDDLGCQMARVVLIVFCHLKLKKNVELYRMNNYININYISYIFLSTRKLRCRVDKR